MVEEMLGTLHQEVSEVKLVDYDQTRMEAKGCPGPKQEKEKRGGRMVVMNSCGQPYLAFSIIITVRHQMHARQSR